MCHGRLIGANVWFGFRSRRSTRIHQQLKKKKSSQRAWWSSSPVGDSSDGDLIKMVTWSLIPFKLLVRCHKIVDIVVAFLILNKTLLTVFFPTACFRELCALCWMLHVRDQLSVSGRKYQAARYGRDGQVFHLGLIVFHVWCINILSWCPMCVCCHPDPCGFRSGIYLHWSSVLDASFSAILLFSQLRGDPPWHTAQPHVWTSSPLSGVKTFSFLFICRQSGLRRVRFSSSLVLLRWWTRWYEPSQKRRSQFESHWEKSITHCCKDWGNAKSSVWTYEHLTFL